MIPQQRFFNREWSWLRFNERVLEEAEDVGNPALERAKFVSIFSSNLDEFFMIRVAGLYRQLEAGIGASGADKRSPREQIDGVETTTQELVRRQEEILTDLLRALSNKGVHVSAVEQLDESARQYARRYYDEVIYPVTTPMIVGPKHPFPSLRSCTLYLVVRLREGERKRGERRRRDRRRLGFVAVPRVLPRFLQVTTSARRSVFVPVESILVHQLERLFTGYAVESVSAIRLTRDADIALDEEATEDMRRAMSKQLLGRRHGAVVRLEHGAAIEPAIRETLRTQLSLEPDQLYPCRGMMQLVDLMQLHSTVDRADLKDVPLQQIVPVRGRGTSIFEWIKEKPRLVHHPYHSFEPVADFVAEAAEDRHVLAIKQTLYRTSGESPVIRSLTRAAELGKQVTVVVELRARFDEERNIEWARRLEQAGAHVVYGLVGYKTHCKALLVVRREPEGIRRYIHLGTGNYNDATARLYTDMGLFVCDEMFGEDVSALFNVITGATEPPVWKKVEMSPNGIRRRLIHLIRREIGKSAPRSPGRIIAKMNSLVDAKVIEALYEASRAGVGVDLVVRGTCCLRPGVPGLSDNIRVRSVVGRFLEHSRVVWFRNGGQHEVYLSSADWMPRNLDRRIELLFPMESEQHRAYVEAMLDIELQDNSRARELRPDGFYQRDKGSRTYPDSQTATYELTRGLVGRPDVSAPRGFVRLAHKMGRVG